MEIQQEAVTISSIITRIKNLKTFADRKYKEIENYYRYDDADRVFNSPMNVPAGNLGGNNRGDMLLQQNAFFVAEQYYFAFLINDNPSEILDKLLALHEENPLVSFSKMEGPAAPLPDQFFPDYQRFMQDIESLGSDLKKVTTDETAWRDYFSIIFKEQSINLIQKYKITPASFKSIVESVTPKLTQTPESFDFAVDIDYFYQLSRMITPTMASFSTSLKDGSTKRSDNTLSELESYLKKLNYMTFAELFQQIFNETFYDKEYEAACKQALSTTEGETPRWTAEQLGRSPTILQDTEDDTTTNREEQDTHFQP